MKRLFVSIPVKGKSVSELITAADRAVQSVEELLGEKFVALTTFLQNAPVTHLAPPLEKLADADVAYFGDGWESVRGCCIEYLCAAEEYRIPIIGDINNKSCEKDAT